MAHSGPIGVEYDQIAGLSQPADISISVQNWHVCLSRLSNAEQRQQLLDGLAASQRNSLRILEEWWYFWCHEMIRNAIVSGDQSYMRDPVQITCLYQKRLYELWVFEFEAGYHRMNENNDLKLSYLNMVRQFAAESAATHRTAMATYQLIVDEQAGPQDLDEGKTSPLVQARLDNHIPACVEPCPWITKTENGNQYPYYLWDKKKRCTVHFEHNVPPYTVISHTWGRFRLQCQEADIPGVPWPVPCVDPSLLFPIEELPVIMDQFPIGTRYIWLDLVCIPQDGRPLQRIEIGRQAGIFMAAKFAVVWMNQVRCWDGLRSALQAEAVAYLQQYPLNVLRDTDWISSSKEYAEQSSGLTLPAKEENEGTPEAPWVFQNQSDETVTPDRWFSSLWTLQEACLRPDMILCDRNWSIFSIGKGEHEVPILLDHLVSLFERPQRPRLKFTTASVHEMRLLLGTSNMSSLLKMRPIDVLINGEMRYCANTDRAVAVMSALGATEWYNSQSSSHVETRVEDLVLGKYPLEFLQEIHGRFGAILFATFDPNALNDVFYELHQLNEEDLSALRGSMLPFSTIEETSLSPKSTFEMTFFIEDHPTIRSWVIQRDGSVYIPHAGILASYSSSSQPQKPVPVDIFPMLPEQKRSRDKVKAEGATQHTESQDDLHSWMSSFRPEAEKYAICLARNLSSSIWGLILERVYPNEDLFVNIGLFLTPEKRPEHPQDDFTFPESVEVNWRVL